MVVKAPEVFVEWDWEAMCWRVWLTDGYHTWQARSFFVPFAFLVALGRYVLDPNKWER